VTFFRCSGTVRRLICLRFHHLYRYYCGPSCKNPKIVTIFFEWLRGWCYDTGWPGAVICLLLCWGKYTVALYDTAVPLTWPLSAWEQCRISTPHFLAECCKRRLNQGSFVLLCFVLFSSRLCLFCVLSVFLSSVLYFPAWTNVNGTV